MKRIIKSTICITSFIMLLAGCGSSKGYTTDTAIAYSTEASDMEASYGSELFDMVAVETEAKYTNESPEETTSSSEIQENVQINQEQKLIRTVSIGAETEYFEDAINEIDMVCHQLNGYVGNSNLYNQTNYRSYSIELRIPRENLDEFLNCLSNMGKMKILHKQVSAEDITLDYYDSLEHKKSLEVERDRILELMEQADSLEYVVELEDKLCDLRYQINSYESSLRRMDNKVNYSTVNVNIDEVRQLTVEKDATVGERISSGLQKNLRNMKNIGTDFFVWFITALPMLVIIAAFVVIMIVIIRKINRKNGKANDKKVNTTDLDTSNNIEEKENR